MARLKKGDYHLTNIATITVMSVFRHRDRIISVTGGGLRATESK